LGTDSYPSLCINCGHGLVLISAPTGGFRTFHDSLDPVRSAVGVYNRRSAFPRSFLDPLRQRGGLHEEIYLPPISSMFLENIFNFWTKTFGPIFALDCSTRISFRSSDTTAHRRRSQLKHFKATGNDSSGHQLEWREGVTTRG